MFIDLDDILRWYIGSIEDFYREYKSNIFLGFLYRNIIWMVNMCKWFFYIVFRVIKVLNYKLWMLIK